MIQPLKSKPSWKSLSEWHLVVAVDDEPAILAALRRSLDTEPYDLVTAEHPRIALDWIRRKKASLIITDQRMPEMQGLQFLEEVWKDSPDTAAIVLTAYPEALTHAHDPRLGALFVKPWNHDQLRSVIRSLLRDREDAGGV